MKVLNVLALLSARAGGPQHFTTEAAAFLPKHGVETTIYASDLAHVPSGLRGRPVRPEELPEGIEELDVHLFPTRMPQRLAYAPSLRAEARRRIDAYDLVHIHSLWLYPQYAAFREAKRRGIPYVVSPHGALDPYLRRRGRVRKALTHLLWQTEMLEGASVIHVVSGEEAKLIEDIAPDVPRSIVPCGIRTAAFAALPGGERFRAQYLAGHAGPIVLFLGRIASKKGVDILITSFARVLKRVPDAHLAIVGPDDELLGRGLAALADDLGVRTSVTFTGPVYRDARLDALAAADVWALPSHTENFGIAVVEALAAGVPTIVSPAVNIARDIEDADAGIVADNTPQIFGDALIELLLDTGRRAELSQNAREFARHYDWDAIAPELASLYAQVVSS